MGRRSWRWPITSAVVLLTAGCAAEGPDTEIEERVAHELVQVWRTGDLATAEELFDGVAVYEDRTSGYEARGAPEAAAYAAAIADWADAVFIEVVDLRAGEDLAVIEWLREGTVMVGDTLRALRLEGTTLLELEGQRIVRATEYFDPSGLIVARGGRVVYPDGVEVVLPSLVEELPAEGDSVTGR